MAERFLTDGGVEKIVRDPRVHRIPERTGEMTRSIVARPVLAQGR